MISNDFYSIRGIFCILTLAVALIILVGVDVAQADYPGYKELYYKHGNNTLVAVSEHLEEHNYKYTIQLLDAKGTKVWENNTVERRWRHLNSISVMEDGSYLISTDRSVFQITKDGKRGFILNWDTIADETMLEKPLNELLIGCGSSITEDGEIMLMTKVTIDNIVNASELPNGNILIQDNGLKGIGREIEVSKHGQVVRRMEGITTPFERKTDDNLTTKLLTSKPVATSNSTVNVVYNNKLVDFVDQQPYIDGNNRTMVPVRFVSELLGANVKWDEGSRKVTITKESIIIELTIGSNVVTVNNIKQEMDTQAVITNKGRTMVPVRFISEILNEQVAWNSENRSVIIKLAD